ncbi:hypothetical protein SDJN03_26957, partial [Cucurbita argyrosperma subsp. sororia]
MANGYMPNLHLLLLLLFSVLGVYLDVARGQVSTPSNWLLKMKSEQVDPVGILDNWSPSTHVLCGVSYGISLHLKS